MPCTLEELYYGCEKNIQVTRKRRCHEEGEDSDEDTPTYCDEKKILKINILSGWKNNRKVIIPNEGDEREGVLLADLEFLIKEIPNQRYSRRGDHLVFNVNVSLVDALTGCSICVPLFDGRKININIYEIIHPDYEKVFCCPNSFSL